MKKLQNVPRVSNSALRTIYIIIIEKQKHVSNPVSEQRLTHFREPGYIIDFTEEDTERIMKILDGDALRISHIVPVEVTEIVNEEISAFLAGHGTSADCAAKIQSRASIWLAEHH